MMVKMPNNEAESEDSGPVNSSDSDSEISDSSSSEMTENELRIGRKIADYNEILCELMRLIWKRFYDKNSKIFKLTWKSSSWF